MSEKTVRIGKDADWLKKNYGYTIKRESEDKYSLDIKVVKPKDQAVSELVKSESDFLNSLSSLMEGETKSDYLALLETLGSLEDVDYWKDHSFKGSDPKVKLLWDCYGTNSFFHLAFTMNYASQTQTVPWTVDENGHVIAEDIDLSYFPMDKLYEAAGSVGEIGYNTHSEGAFTISFVDDDGLYYACFMRDAGDGFVDLSIKLEGDKLLSGGNEKILENYSESLDRIVPALLTDDQKAIWNTTWDEMKAASDVESLYMFPLSEKEWWSLMIGGSCQLHLDCSQPR